MIVDVHTHVFVADTDFGPKLKADLDRCKIDPSIWGNVTDRHLEDTKAADIAIVFGLQASATDWNIPNEFVANHVSKAADRMLFFVSIDPLQKDYMEQLEKFHQQYNAVGVKLSPLYQNIHPQDPKYYEIYTYCNKHGLPILFHAGTSFVSGTPLDYSRPIYFDKIAMDFPELKIVLAHLAHPWESEAIALIRRHRHVYCDVSALYYRPWQFYNSMRLLEEYKTHEKVLFGSDFPFTTTSDSIQGVRNLNHVVLGSGLPTVSSEIIEGIIHRDTLSCLGLLNPKLY